MICGTAAISRYLLGEAHSRYGLMRALVRLLANTMREERSGGTVCVRTSDRRAMDMNPIQSAPRVPVIGSGVTGTDVGLPISTNGPHSSSSPMVPLSSAMSF